MGSTLPSGESPRFAAFVRLALPMIASRAGLATMGVADAIMVSRFDPASFAQLSLAEGTMGRLLDVFVALVVGGMALVARFHGKGDAWGAWNVWRRTVVVAVVMGVLGFVASLWSAPLWQALGQPPELWAGGAPLAQILAFGFPAALLAISAAVYLEGTGRPAIVAVAVVGANILNILLNFLLIDGRFGLPALGASGCAMATTLVRIGLAVVLVAALLRHRPTGPSVSPAGDAGTARTQWRMGIGAALTVAALLAMGASLTIYAGWLGPISLATFSASMSLAALIALVALGLSDATGVMVATAAGREGDSRSGPAVWSGLAMTLVPVTALCLGLVLFRSSLAPVYTDLPAMQAGMIAIIPLLALSLLVDTVGFVMGAALRALREVVWPAAIQMVSMALVVVLGWHLGFRLGFGLVGLFLAMLACSLSRSVLLTLRLLWRYRVSGPDLSPAGAAP